MTGATARTHALAMLLPAIVAAAIARAPDTQVSAHGIYSNMRARDGDYSGYEVIVLPSNEGDFVVFQVAEGYPQKPVLLPATVGADRDAAGISIAFDHPEMGPFAGTITADSLAGEFPRMRHRIALARGPSIWQ